jgi:3-deoxy-D-manno-octulosonic-acid transferase
MKNFLAITQLMLDAGALLQVADSSELPRVLLELFESAEKRTTMGQAGLDVVERNQGALDCVAQLLQQSLKQSS